MELAIAQQDSDILLKEKNNLTESVLDKYRLAGQVSQTCLFYITNLINDSYHLNKVAKPYSIQELCILGDSYMKSALDKAYKKGANAVRERGIAIPVNIECNEIVSGFAPEIDDTANFFFKAGDIVTITLGCQIDGYTANASHTIVIYPPGIISEGGEQLRPEGPLLGPKADAIAAAHIATETITNLLSCSLTPEKLPANLKVINGELIRNLVDSIADSFNCVVVPGSRVRRIRRFLAGQAEGVVAEKEFKGVVWSESDQEAKLLLKNKKFTSQSEELIKFDTTKNTSVNNASAIPTDEFVVSPNEVYMIDIKMSPLSELNETGLVTLETIDDLSGKDHKENAFRSKPTIFIRDFAVTHQLKLKTSRQLLGKVDKDCSVYPFKLSHVSSNFPVNINDLENIEGQLNQIKSDIKTHRLGLSELANRHLVVPRPIQVARFIPLATILNASNPTGARGFDADKPTLPGLELPLPRLNISSLKLKSLLKQSITVPVARELTTIVISKQTNEILRLTGGSKTGKPSWIHSNYSIQGEYKDFIQHLSDLSQDKKFGLKINECQPFKLQQQHQQNDDAKMQMD